MATYNIGGCDALRQKILYKDRKLGKRGFHESGMPGWASGKANLILVPIFSGMDGMVLYSIFDECLTQSAAMGIIMALGVAVVLNVLPLVIAKFLHAAFDKTAKHASAMAGIFLAGFILIYGGTVYLRFAYSDMYGQENQSTTLENTVSNEEAVDSEEDMLSDNKKGTAVVLLLSISPLITSLLGFGIAYVSDDETRKKVEYLEIEKIEIEEKISDTQAAIVQMEHVLKEETEKDLAIDAASMNAAVEEIFTRCDILKALARLYLAEYLKNPSATSRISQEMRVQMEEDPSQAATELPDEMGTVTTNEPEEEEAEEEWQVV